MTDERLAEIEARLDRLEAAQRAPQRETEAAPALDPTLEGFDLNGRDERGRLLPGIDGYSIFPSQRGL